MKIINSNLDQRIFIKMWGEKSEINLPRIFEALKFDFFYQLHNLVSQKHI